jgi:hypothetical protein
MWDSIYGMTIQIWPIKIWICVTIIIFLYTHRPTIKSVHIRILNLHITLRNKNNFTVIFFVHVHIYQVILFSENESSDEVDVSQNSTKKIDAFKEFASSQIISMMTAKKSKHYV